MNELIEKLAHSCIDWDGTEMPDNAEPITTATCGDIRKIIAYIYELEDSLESHAIYP